MKVLIIGAGRMGIRHAIGALQVDEISSIVVSDLKEESLSNAKNQLSSAPNSHKLKFSHVDSLNGFCDVVIISATANDRISICKQALKFNPSYLLIEKPLGQSIEEVQGIVNFFSDKQVVVSVNLNMRMYSFVRQLKNDLHTFPQFMGIKHINFNGGALGIGANGIHYLDLLFYLLDASYAELRSGDIETNLIPSGRGPDFGDFGGWGCFYFFDVDKKLVGQSILSLSSTSSVFGGWDIIGSHGRIRINELEGERVDILRNPQSNLPVNRYAADYLPSSRTKIESPNLSDLTKEWLESIIKSQINLLPTIEHSLKIHQLMFTWLRLSTTHHNIFPIT